MSPAGLPRDYIAVRFYFNESFPDTEENKLFVTSLLDTLTETNDVVLLNPDLHIDDHWDMRPGRNSRIHTVDHLMTPQNNLAVQTKVISRARAFVGTYGGLSYLAPLYGVTSLAFYSHRERFNVQHLELARRVFGRFKKRLLCRARHERSQRAWSGAGRTARTAGTAARTQSARHRTGSGASLDRVMSFSSLFARLIPALGRQHRRLSEQSEALTTLRQRVRDLLGRAKEQERLLALATEGSAELRDHARHHRAATRRAALLGRSDRPIVVGPWCGEVGFELLYWIPFVQWLVERARIEGQRLVVVTRGGASVWYRDLTNRSVEIFDLINADAFRDHAATWKQHRISAFDRQLLADAIAAAGVRRARLLHPQVMYRLLTGVLEERRRARADRRVSSKSSAADSATASRDEYAPRRVRRGQVLFQPVVS